jgi:DNA-binding CsgD family transcriptional regulator/endogenous inhibitor of DNA gyrase (YacG/DUF329 family)
MTPPVAYTEGILSFAFGGGSVMTQQQKETIIKMRRDGCSYSRIAADLSISENTVKSFCRRNNLGGAYAGRGVKKEVILCRQCGTPIAQTIGIKQKLFCSDKCRLAWWNDHPEAVNRKAIYTFVCPTCSREFASYGNKHRKYCSRTCYMKERFGSRLEGGDRE